MPPLLLSSSSPPSADGVVCRRRRKRAKRSVSARASWQELAGVLVFSAVPFTAVKALAGSPLGALLRRRLEARKDSAAAEADALRAAARQARGSSFWYGGARPRWLGPIPYEYPEHLDGEFPGDYGFDIAGLGRDPVAFANYFKFPEHKWSSRMEEYIENALVAQWLGLAVATHPSQVRSLLGTISWTYHRLLSSLYCEAVRRSGVTRCKQGVKSKMKASTCRGGRGGKGREETQKR